MFVASVSVIVSSCICIYIYIYIYIIIIYNVATYNESMYYIRIHTYSNSLVSRHNFPLGGAYQTIIRILLSDAQFGFCENHSAELQLIATYIQLMTLH